MRMQTQSAVLEGFFKQAFRALPASYMANEGHMLTAGDSWAEPLEAEAECCTPESYPSDLVDRTTWTMNRSRGLAAVLEAELDFIERGGYRHFQRCWTDESPVFRMSPTCVNFGHAERIGPCSVCALWEMVPRTASVKRLPCHFIPLDDQGTTVHDLAPFGEEGVERSVAQWIRRRLRELKQQGG